MLGITRAGGRIAIALLVAIGLLLLGVGIYHSVKPLPAGLNYDGPLRPVGDVRFLSDTSYIGPDDQRHLEQSIFDEVFAMIGAAERFVLIDMFLFNAFQGEVPEEHRALSAELTERLLAQKRRYPDLQAHLITDPINTVYGGQRAVHLDRLEQAGITVTVTRLEALRDSNPLYSSIWRTFLSYWGTGTGTRLENPLGDGRISLRSFLILPNFKANHRKVVIADQGDGFAALVTSANPHDGSSAHGNVALRFTGPAVLDLLTTEQAVLAFSGGPAEAVNLPPQAASEPAGAGLRVVTERAIKQALLSTINRVNAGDRLDIAVFYLSDRDIVNALLAAHDRQAQLRLLLDANKDAFGREKNGIPNRQTALELHRAGIPVRWCETRGEQCHSKFMLARHADGQATLIVGSANFTRRNLNNLNLETNMVLTGQASQLTALAEAAEWFELRWFNTADKRFSVDYPVYADERLWPQALYRFMEATGISTF
ncbi:phospholipase D-like domain-containing protein [Saccharospirillum impatiens]|uniref:phospholipase D-like domain-containing protein n=1 Tax=Saccharospirillum impatiens TaxID=169438 RepID=UPI000417042F|nr:phospholipase D-like domain-containing protein [Saccharospirillum impatiens]